MKTPSKSTLLIMDYSENYTILGTILGVIHDKCNSEDLHSEDFIIVQAKVFHSLGYSVIPMISYLCKAAECSWTESAKKHQTNSGL